MAFTGKLLKSAGTGIKITTQNFVGSVYDGHEGLKFTLSDLSEVYFATVYCMDSTDLTHTYYPVVTEKTGNTINVRVYRQDGTSGTLNQIPDGTDLSNYVFVVLALGQ